MHTRGHSFIPPRIRMRQRNKAEEKLLQKRLVDIEADYRKQNGKIITEIVELNHVLSDFDRDVSDCLQYFDSVASQKTQTSRKASNIGPKPHIGGEGFRQRKNNYLMKESTVHCRFASRDDMTCQHFPCAVPKGYNSIGFQIHPKPYPARLLCADTVGHSTGGTDVSDTFEGNCHDPSNLPDVESPRTIHTSSDVKTKLGKPSAREKVRALKKALEDKKRKHLAAKPKPWETNYGDAVPLRCLANPLRPAPSESG